MSLRRKKQVKFNKPEAPRAMDDIKKEHTELSYRLGNAEYQSFVYQRDAETIKQRLIQVNQEAAERNRLDAEAAAKEEPKEAKNE